MDFTLPANNRVELKESEKKDKYLDLAKGSKKLRNIKVTFIPIIIGALDTVNKRLLKGLEGLDIKGRVETIQTTIFFGLARILRRVLET